jgi:acyl-coenzyme A thioesterase PaaI-like protein
MEEPIFNPFASEEISPPYSEHWEAKRRVAQALRELTDVLVTSTPSVEDMNEIAERLELQASQFAKTPRRYGLRAFVEDGEHGGHAEVNHELNALAGWSNPLSPGMNMWFEGNEAVASVTCGYAYEGPPGYIHGGYVAAIFDQFLGMAQMLGKSPGMTGTLGVRYLRPTPLNTELRLRAELDRVDGRKTFMKATMHAGETLTATCEALFVRPAQGMHNLT